MMHPDSVNGYLLKRHRLSPSSRADSPAAVIRELIAIDADSLKDLFYTISIRVNGFDAARFSKALNEGRDFARVRGLKNAMQAVDASAMPLIYAVSKKDREARVAMALKKWGISEEEYGFVSEAIKKALGMKEKTLPQLKNSIPEDIARDMVMPRSKHERTTNVAVVATAMHDRWDLLRGGVGTDPLVDPGRYSLFARRFKRVDIPYREALDALLDRYVAAYGPVTKEDFAWWAGISLIEVPDMSRFRGIGIKGIKDEFYVKDMPSFGPEKGVEVPVAKNDPYIRAYFNMERILGDYPVKGLVDKFGDPVDMMLKDGRIAGPWKRLS